jgi:hypothetical protein
MSIVLFQINIIKKKFKIKIKYLKTYGSQLVVHQQIVPNLVGCLSTDNSLSALHHTPMLTFPSNE